MSRGLTFNDSAGAERHLEHIGDYRFSGYAEPFETGGGGPNNRHYRAGTTFEDVLDRYVFDRKLRLVVMDGIERIEIAVRAGVSNSIALAHGPHWYRNPAFFNAPFRHADFITDIQRQIGHDPTQNHKRDIFIKHYYATYNDPTCRRAGWSSRRFRLERFRWRSST
jgi:abortive infection bacteriophage resistance protein